MNYGIVVKTAAMARAVWVSPKGTTRLTIHASTWPTQEAAQQACDALTSDTRNAHIIARVKALA